MGAVQFEPEIRFPDHPYDAACIYLGALAYLAAGAGQAGEPGQAFASALAAYLLWAAQKVKGLTVLRRERNDPGYLGPKRRDFRGVLDRGLRRVDRRMAAYDFYGSQLVTGFFALGQSGEGRAAEVFQLNAQGSGPARAELWREATPSAHMMMKASGDHWLERFALNHTGPSADAKQRVKDVHRRGLTPSIPVLHMAHGLAEAALDVGNQIQGWGKRDPFLALLMNAEAWIWCALEKAETWRQMSYFPAGILLSPEKMISLVWTDQQAQPSQPVER